MKKENIVLAVNSDVSKENDEKIDKDKAEEVVGDVKELSSGGEMFDDPQEVEKAKAAHNAYSGNGRVDIFDPTPVVEKYDSVYPSSYFLEKVGSGDADEMREFEDYEVIEGLEYAYPESMLRVSNSAKEIRIALLIGDGKVEEFYRGFRESWNDEQKFKLGDAVAKGKDVKAVSFARVAKEKDVKPGKEEDWTNDPYANYVVFGSVNEKFLKLEDNLEYLKKIQSYPEDIELTATAKDVPILELGATNGSELELVKQTGAEDIEIEGAVTVQKSRIFMRMGTRYKQEPFINKEDEELIIGYGKKFTECIPEQEKGAWMYPVICGDDELSNHHAFYLYERISYFNDYIKELKKCSKKEGLIDEVTTSFYGAIITNFEKLSRERDFIRLSISDDPNALRNLVELRKGVTDDNLKDLNMNIEEIKKALSFLIMLSLFKEDFFRYQHFYEIGVEEEEAYSVEEELQREVEKVLEEAKSQLESEGHTLDIDFHNYVLENYKNITYLLSDFYIKASKDNTISSELEYKLREIERNARREEDTRSFLQESTLEIKYLIEKVLVPLGLIKR